MNPRWRLCPECAKVGNHTCTLCGGNGGWYIAPFRPESRVTAPTDVESFISTRPTPRALDDGDIVTESSISDKLCSELVDTIDSGDYALTDWDVEFIGGNLGKTSFSTKQKAVIYKLARKLKLI